MKSSRTAPAAATRATAPVRRRLAPRHRGGHPRRSIQPLHEALALGLGCTATGYRMSTPAEWS